MYLCLCQWLWLSPSDRTQLVVGPGNYVYALADINSWNQFFFRFDGQNEIFNNSFNWDTWQDSIDLRNRTKKSKA